MLSLFLSWALIQSVCPHTAVTNSPLMREAFRLDEPEVVLVPAAVSQYRLRNVPIRVCGYLVGPRGSDRAEALEANGAYLLIEQSADQPKPFQSTCILGVIYRKDGLSEAESRAAGLPERVVVHGPSPDYVLYRCKDMDDCKELARAGPRGRGQVR
jgi:hypothetical protein